MKQQVKGFSNLERLAISSVDFDKFNAIEYMKIGSFRSDIHLRSNSGQNMAWLE